MASLKLVKFECVEDTDEIGFESPYFLTFIADTRFLSNGFEKLPEVHLTRKNFWNNKVDKGEVWPVNANITSTFSLSPDHTLVLAAMIEKDEGVDISGAEIATIRNKMSQSWTAHIQGGFQINDSGLTHNLSNAFEGAINTALSTAVGADDDLMENSVGKAVRRVTLTHEPGTFAAVSFPGGGGFYRVWYGRS